jgi:RNA polymerase sigma factor (sigma-70 family)
MEIPEQTVFIVDDDHGVRDALEILVDSAGFEARSFSSAVEFLERYEPGSPGCLVLDIRMPNMSGLELQDTLAEKAITLPIIFLTGHGNVSMSARAFRSGAIDFLEKPFGEDELIERIHEALRKDRANREDESRRKSAHDRLASLTPREYEVMRLLVAGRSNKEIAEELGLSPRTIETHRGRIMDKTDVESLAELVELSIIAGSGKSR